MGVVRGGCQLSQLGRWEGLGRPWKLFFKVHHRRERQDHSFLGILGVFIICAVAVGDAGSGWNDGQVSLSRNVWI